MRMDHVFIRCVDSHRERQQRRDEQIRNRVEGEQPWRVPEHVPDDQRVVRQVGIVTRPQSDEIVPCGIRRDIRRVRAVESISAMISAPIGMSAMSEATAKVGIE